MPRQTKNQPSSSFSSFKKIAIGFIVLAIILLVFIVYFSFAKATIILSIDQEPKTLSFDLNMVTLDSEETGDLIGEIVFQEIEVSQDFSVQNYEERPGLATGKIKIINNRSVNQTLVATTRFLSPENILFRLEKTVVVPANSELVADVYADEQGVEYNLEPTQFSIPGLSEILQQQVYGISDEAMTGGIKKVGVLTQSDVDTANKEFLEDLSQQLKDKLDIEELSLDVKLIKGRVLESELSNQIDEEVDGFTLTAKVLAQAVIVDNDEMLSKAKDVYKEKLAGQIQVTNWNLDGFDYSLKSIELDNKTAVISVTITANVQGAFNIEQFDKTEIAGFDRKGVEYYFSQYPSIQNVEIRFWPFWVRSVPALADRIEIVVE